MTDEQKQKLKDYRVEYYAAKKLNNKTIDYEIIDDDDSDDDEIIDDDGYDSDNENDS